MDAFIDFGGKTQGRDKLYRIIQYASKLLGWGLNEMNGNQDLLEKIAKLESHASLGRKFFRLGRCIEGFKAAQRTIYLDDPLLRTTLSIGHINRSLFLAIDHYLWCGKVGLLTVDKTWEFRSARFFLAAITLSIVRDVYELLNVIDRWHVKDKDQQKLIQAKLKAATIDITKNLFDLAIPGSKLGYFPTHNGLVGLFGLISSVLGAYQLANPSIKLKP